MARHIFLVCLGFHPNYESFLGSRLELEQKSEQKHFHINNSLLDLDKRKDFRMNAKVSVLFPDMSGYFLFDLYCSKAVLNAFSNGASAADLLVASAINLSASAKAACPSTIFKCA